MSSLRGLYDIAFCSLLRHRLRSFLSILGVICGVAAVFATLSIGEGAKREVLAGIRELGLDNIIVRGLASSATQPLRPGEAAIKGLSSRDVALLKGASPAIVEVAYLKELQVDVQGGEGLLRPQVVACSPSYFTLLGLGVARGRMMLDSDQSQNKMICLLGKGIARKLGYRGTVGTRIRIGDQLFFIAGILRSDRVQKGARVQAVSVLARETEEMVFLPFGTHRYVVADEAGPTRSEFDELIVKMRSEQDAEEIVPLVSRTLSLSHQALRDYQLIVPWQLLYQAQKTQRIFNMVLAAIGTISLIVGGIGIMNVLLAGISERTREIGIRRAVGARRTDIVSQFLAESLLLTTFGGIAGIAAGLVGSLLIAGVAGWSVAVTPLTVVIPFMTSVVVGVCAGVYPAITAGRMDPVQALRSA